jgi:hypothetical protein
MSIHVLSVDKRPPLAEAMLPGDAASPSIAEVVLLPTMDQRAWSAMERVFTDLFVSHGASAAQTAALLPRMRGHWNRIGAPVDVLVYFAGVDSADLPAAMERARTDFTPQARRLLVNHNGRALAALALLELRIEQLQLHH